MSRLQADFDDRLIHFQTVDRWQSRHTIDTTYKKTAQTEARSTQLTRKPSQTEARSTQLTDYQARRFWQCPQPPPDLPNSVTQGFSIEHRKILAQRDRHKSAQIGTIDTRQNENVAIGRTEAENPRCSAQKKGNLRRHETIADKGLRAFLSVIAGRKRSEIGHRYNLKKAAQVGTRSTQIISNHHDRHMPKRGCRAKVACCKEIARTLRATKCSTHPVFLSFLTGATGARCKISLSIHSTAPLSNSMR